MARRLRRREHATNARIAGDPLKNGLRPRANAKGLERIRTQWPVEHAVAERAMGEDPQAEFGGHGKHSLLRLAAARIVGDLDHVEASRPHQVAEIVETA